ncbi:MAG: DUF5063 domain-containing protein [Chryseolinea sp.]
MTVDQAIERQETLDFLKVAAEYCSFVENENSQGLEFQIKTRRILASLYLTAIQIPEVSVTSDKEFDNRVTDDQQQKIIKKLSDNINTGRFYWDTFDPTDENDKEPVCDDLVDDLGDIYRDIKSCLTTYDQGTIDAREHGLWELKFTFNAHWGQHNINALRALHSIIEHG